MLWNTTGFDIALISEANSLPDLSGFRKYASKEEGHTRTIWVGIYIRNDIPQKLEWKESCAILIRILGREVGCPSDILALAVYRRPDNAHIQSTMKAIEDAEYLANKENCALVIGGDFNWNIEELKEQLQKRTETSWFWNTHGHTRKEYGMKEEAKMSEIDHIISNIKPNPRNRHDINMSNHNIRWDISDHIPIAEEYDLSVVQSFHAIGPNPDYAILLEDLTQTGWIPSLNTLLA